MNKAADYQARRKTQMIERYNLILELLHTPMTIKQLAIAMPFVFKNYKTDITTLLDNGNVVMSEKDKNGIGQKKCYLYKTVKTPYVENSEPPKKSSQIYLLSETHHWTRTVSRDRVYVSGSTLGGAM